MISKVWHNMDINCTQDQLDRYDFGYELIQNVFPQLSPGEREFIKTGITPEEWNAKFGKEEI
jgi:hypothetical protein